MDLWRACWLLVLLLATARHNWAWATAAVGNNSCNSSCSSKHQLQHQLYQVVRNQWYQATSTAAAAVALIVLVPRLQQ